MPKVFEVNAGGQIVDAATKKPFGGAAVRDMNVGDKFTRPDGKTEAIVSKETTPDGFVIVRTVGG